MDRKHWLRKEVVLLNDKDGTFARVPYWSLNYALAGGVLMDLALENRIDTDLENLVLVDESPLGDSLLDPTLADIAANEQRDPKHWVEQTASHADTIREEALARLVDNGILERRDDRFLWVFKSRRYVAVKGEAEREVKRRIMEVLFSDSIPDPRDVVIICLADACGIFDKLLTKQELEMASDRIKQVRQTSSGKPCPSPSRTSRCWCPHRCRPTCTRMPGGPGILDSSSFGLRGLPPDSSSPPIALQGVPSSP